MPVKVRYSDELYHHGILGQKWGVRRYQNPDGTLTPEGVERYRKKVSNTMFRERLQLKGAEKELLKHQNNAVSILKSRNVDPQKVFYRKNGKTMIDDNFVNKLNLSDKEYASLEKFAIANDIFDFDVQLSYNFRLNDEKKTTKLSEKQIEQILDSAIGNSFEDDIDMREAAEWFDAVVWSEFKKRG